jgi:Fur family ferric uptake transcriptional regulator/Fur family peroxide stress response transcriptional regulator
LPRPHLYREAILRLLQQNPIHPTVDWIHRALRKREPRVSLATVYRTLRVLVAEGILCELPFGTAESRFGYVKEQNHYHFICDSCGHIHDLATPPRTGLEATVSKATGHRAVRHTTEFFGICRNCLTPSAPSTRPRKTKARKPSGAARGAGTRERKTREKKGRG